MMTLK